MNVLAWVDAQIIETLFLSTISLAELRFGIAVLAEGKRSDALASGLEQRILPLFTGRILTLDTLASQAYASLRSRTRSVGQAIAPADGYIAAIAATHGFTVATRDTSPFEAAGVAIINPWTWSAH